MTLDTSFSERVATAACQLASAFSHCPLIPLASEFGAVFLRLNTLDSSRTGDSQVVNSKASRHQTADLSSVANWALR